MKTRKNRFLKGVVFILLLSVFSSWGYAQQERQEKIRLAVVDFTTTDQKLEPSNLNQIVSEWLTLFLVNAGTVEVVERQELQKILQEQSLGQTGVISTESAAKLGELLGIKILVTGAVMKLGNTLEVTARLIDTSNGAIVGAFSVMAADVNQLRPQIQLLAENISRKLTGTGTEPPKEEKIGVMPEEIKLRESFDGDAFDPYRWRFDILDDDRKNTKLIQKDSVLTLTGTYQKPNEQRLAGLYPGFEIQYHSMGARIRVREVKGTVCVGPAINWNYGLSSTDILMCFEENNGLVRIRSENLIEIPVESHLRLNQWYLMRLDYKDGQFQYYWNGSLSKRIPPNTSVDPKSRVGMHFNFQRTKTMTIDIDEIILR
jgi:TolB-like protein